eukprot:SAG22_NODE_962_length_6280_cov_4.343472_2_plen_43_part_00
MREKAKAKDTKIAEHLATIKAMDKELENLRAATARRSKQDLL